MQCLASVCSTPDARSNNAKPEAHPTSSSAARNGCMLDHDHGSHRHDVSGSRGTRTRSNGCRPHGSAADPGLSQPPLALLPDRRLLLQEPRCVGEGSQRPAPRQPLPPSEPLWPRAELPEPPLARRSHDEADLPQTSSVKITDVVQISPGAVIIDM